MRPLASHLIALCHRPSTCHVRISTACSVLLIHVKHHVAVIVFHHMWERWYGGEEWGSHHSLGLIEMQITHHLFYLQAFSSPRITCKLTWPEVQLQGEGYLTQMKAVYQMLSSLFFYFCFSSGACWLYAEKPVCTCQTSSCGQQTWDWGSWSSCDRVHRWAEGGRRPFTRRGSCLPSEGADTVMWWYGNAGPGQCPVPPLPAKGQFVICTCYFKGWREAKGEGKQSTWTELQNLHWLFSRLR